VVALRLMPKGGASHWRRYEALHPARLYQRNRNRRSCGDSWRCGVRRRTR
jgi:hypothetical protein